MHVRDNPGSTACYDLMTMCACCNFSTPLLISIIYYLFEFYSVGEVGNCSRFNEAIYWIPCTVFVIGKLRSKVLEIMCSLKSACSGSNCCVHVLPSATCFVSNMFRY
jgi:hypothetical protein